MSNQKERELREEVRDLRATLEMRDAQVDALLEARDAFVRGINEQVRAEYVVKGARIAKLEAAVRTLGRCHSCSGQGGVYVVNPWEHRPERLPCGNCSATGLTAEARAALDGRVALEAP